MSAPSSPATETAARQRWMGVLARAGIAELRAVWDRLAPRPDWSVLRRPEVGLVMIQGRAGGDGGAFNLGEMTVTRCSVRAGGRVGHAWVAGRAPDHAEIAAVLDALLQDPDGRVALEAAVVAPLEAAWAAARARRAAQAGATRVDFFTLVRGED